MTFPLHGKEREVLRSWASRVEVPCQSGGRGRTWSPFHPGAASAAAARQLDASAGKNNLWKSAELGEGVDPYSTEILSVLL